jgi:hypothetical protein
MDHEPTNPPSPTQAKPSTPGVSIAKKENKECRATFQTKRARLLAAPTHSLITTIAVATQKDKKPNQTKPSQKQLARV